MGWWKRLKMWQKGGILLGIVHVIAYFVGIILFGPVFGYFVIFLEYPWVYLYDLLRYPGVSLLFFPIDLIIGTAFYAAIGAFGGWGVSMMKSGKLIRTLA